MKIKGLPRDLNYETTALHFSPPPFPNSGGENEPLVSVGISVEINVVF